MTMSENKRVIGIDLLRCLSMFLIVCTHSYCHGEYAGSSRWLTLVFSSLLVWHVDAFLSISGWFGIKTRLDKIVSLLGQMLFYSLLSIGYVYFFDHNAFSLKLLKIDGGWFGNTYLFLMLVAPFINAGVEALSKEVKTLVGAWLLLAVGFVLEWSPLGVKLGFCHCGEQVYSLFTFVFVYLTVRVVRVSDFDLRRWALPITIGFMAMTFAIFLVGGRVELIAKLQNYRAPHVWMMAIALVGIFSKVKSIGKRGDKIISVIAPSMFGVYLLHDTTSFGSLLYRVPEAYLAGLGCPIWVAILLSATLTFLVCVAVDICRRSCIEGVKAAWRRIRR